MLQVEDEMTGAQSTFGPTARRLAGACGWALIALGVLVVLTVYGEFRSISAAIERIPLLKQLDSLGRVS